MFLTKRKSVCSATDTQVFFSGHGSILVRFLHYSLSGSSPINSSLLKVPLAYALLSVAVHLGGSNASSKTIFPINFQHTAVSVTGLLHRVEVQHMTDKQIRSPAGTIAFQQNDAFRLI